MRYDAIVALRRQRKKYVRYFFDVLASRKWTLFYSYILPFSMIGDLLLQTVLYLSLRVIVRSRIYYTVSHVFSGFCHQVFIY